MPARRRHLGVYFELDDDAGVVCGFEDGRDTGDFDFSAEGTCGVHCVVVLHHRCGEDPSQGKSKGGSAA